MLVAGARPNFMKIAPLYWELSKPGSRLVPVILHTGQHYDDNMSDEFFRDLSLPSPDFHLGIGSGTHSQQTARIMEAFDRVLNESRPDAVIVVGDVNSTLACALVTAKVNFTPDAYSRPLIVHVEAGLRSFDGSMPEEINRRVTDQLSDLLFVSEPSGIENLRREGFSHVIEGVDLRQGQILPDHPSPSSLPLVALVGNVMIDCLVRMMPVVKKKNPFTRLGFSRDPDRPLVLVTIHRPSNVDHAENLAQMMETLFALAREAQVIFPVHPRTRKRLDSINRLDRPGLHLVEPLGYLDFLALQTRASLVITDSGGIQEETTALGVPCLTIRENTERPITIFEGTNRLVRNDRVAILESVRDVLSIGECRGKCPKLWDGRAAERIVGVIERVLLHAH